MSDYRNGFLNSIEVMQHRGCVSISRNGISGASSVGISLHLENDEADELESKLRDLRYQRIGAARVAAECLDLAATTGPVRGSPMLVDQLERSLAETAASV